MGPVNKQSELKPNTCRGLVHYDDEKHYLLFFLSTEDVLMVRQLVFISEIKFKTTSQISMEGWDVGQERTH